MPLPSISFVLIHNHDAERLNHVRPQIRKLAETVGGSVMEISDQPPVVPNARLLTCRWYLVRQIIERQGAKYVSQPMEGLFRFLMRVTKTSVRILLPTRTASRLRQLSARRMTVTPKHIEAWRNHGTERDYLIVMEDDVVFRPDSMEAFAKLMPVLQSLPSNEFAYIDLAGGFAFDDIGLSNWIDGRNDAFVTFSRPVTNTVCCYVLNAKLAEHLASETERRPILRTLDADWLINAVMMRLAAKSARFNCLHACPTIFDHGSATGAYVSSLPN